MICTYDALRYLEKHQHEDRCELKLSEDKKHVISKATGEILVSLEEYTQFLREKHHCDFETIYFDKISLSHVFRCNACKTVIFAYDDENYDPNLRCPTCCNDPSVCYFEYWTSEQISADPDKQKTIEGLEAYTARENRAYKRYKERGLWDHQRWRKIFKFKKHSLELTLVDFSYDGDTGKHCRPSDRYLEVRYFDNAEGICRHPVDISLSWRHFYYRYLYRFVKKFRKGKKNVADL